MTIANRALRVVTNTTDLSRSRVARYIQLATLFRNWIASGEWPIGGRIPNVDELALEFSVARGTIREALGVLEEEGPARTPSRQGHICQEFAARRPRPQARDRLEVADLGPCGRQD